MPTSSFCGGMVVALGGYYEATRMIGYRLKRALIAETYAAKHHYNWVEGDSGGREARGLLPAGGGFWRGFTFTSLFGRSYIG